jgi:hypothetical protein
VSERIAQAFWFAVLLVCVFSADQFLAAQPVSDEHKDNDICSQQKKYSYLVNGVPRYVPYSVIDGRDVVEGDIVIGDAQGSSYFPPAVPPFVNLQATRWEGNVVPYVIDSSIDKPYRALIQQAMSEWRGNTNIRFEELFGPRDWRKENYVKFVDGGRCETNSFGVRSKVGQPNDEEHQINVVWVGDCTFYEGDHVPSWGRVAHEIGHVLGLGHEQSRSDRDKNITVLWDNLDDKAQFCTGILATRPDTAYDYDSIMHYSPLQDVKPSGCHPVQYGEKMKCLSFFPKPEKAPLWPKSPNIGQRDHLSKGDIEAVNALYPAIRPTEPPPLPVQSCVIVTKTTIRVGDRTIETTKTEPCAPGGRPIPSDQQCCQERRCCHEKIVVARPCYPDRCRPPVKVKWPRPDRWCCPGCCRPRPRPLCDRWVEDRWEPPPFDDWDDRW